MKCAIFVCPNGYGHLRRVIHIIKSLEDSYRSPEIHVFLSHELINSTLTAQYLEISSCVSLHILQLPHPSYVSLFDSLSDLNGSIPSSGYDLCISDNLIYPLFFTNSSLKILSANFLWSHKTAVSNSHSLASRSLLLEFYSIEKLLLDQCSECEIVGSAVFAMRDISSLPNFNPIGLFPPVDLIINDQNDVHIHASRHMVLVAHSASRFVHADLQTINNVIYAARRIWNMDVVVTPRLYTVLGGYERSISQPFDFSPFSFTRLKCAIVRPGLGIISDLLYYGVPTIALDLGSNEELIHNAEALSYLYQQVFRLDDFISGDMSIPRNSSVDFRYLFTGPADIARLFP